MTKEKILNQEEWTQEEIDLLWNQTFPFEGNDDFDEDEDPDDEDECPL